MFNLIKPWLFQATADRPLWLNRVVPGLEDLEPRALLASGVVPAANFVGPLPALTSAADGGSTRFARAPIQNGAGSNGTTGPGGQPGASTLAPLVNTTLGANFPGVNGGPGLPPYPTSIPPGPGTLGGTPFGGQTLLPGATGLGTPATVLLPGQGTPGAAFVGGQILLPGVVTTPATPMQQEIQLAMVNTADPYALFEQTILTKPGERTASGDATPVQARGNNPPNRAVVFEALAEDEGQVLLAADPASTDNPSALNPSQADAFFDSALTGE